jgi:hypothetical protein
MSGWAIMSALASKLVSRQSAANTLECNVNQREGIIYQAVIENYSICKHLRRVCFLVYLITCCSWTYLSLLSQGLLTKNTIDVAVVDAWHAREGCIKRLHRLRTSDDTDGRALQTLINSTFSLDSDPVSPYSLPPSDNSPSFP